MGNFWLKIKVWSKGIIFALIALYSLAFLLFNMGQPPVTVWFWYRTNLTISPLLLVFATFLLGAIAAILFRTTLTTIRQVRELRSRNRIDRLEREHAEMKAKASRLRTSNPASGAPAPTAPSPTEPPIQP
jgi:hypothetical protein